MIGSDFNDTINGNFAANILNGGKGTDTLTGGGGNDTFIIAPGEGGDVITDFTVGQDRFQLSAAGFGVAGRHARAGRRELRLRHRGHRVRAASHRL